MSEYIEKNINVVYKYTTIIFGHRKEEHFMADMTRDEKACAGIGFSAGAAGLATLGRATSTVGSGMLAAGITNCVAAASGIAQLAVLGGQAIAAIPVVAPIAVVGGLAYAGYNGIRYIMEEN